MARLPYVNPETASAEVRETLAALPAPLKIFRMMAHAETCFRPLIRLGTAILGAQKLDAKLRELVILRVARLSGAEYEWTQHAEIGRVLGVTESQLEALRRDDPAADCFGADEKLVLEFATEIVRDVGASEATFARAAERFGPRETVELILAVGYYMMIARLLETTGVDLEPAAGGRIADAAVVAARSRS